MCLESVCLSVCPRGYLQKHTRDLCQFVVHVAYGRCRVTKFQEEGAVLGVFFPIDYALYSIAFGTRTKSAELIDLPYGMTSGLSPWNSVLLGATIPEGEGVILWKTCARHTDELRIGLVHAAACIR